MVMIDPNARVETVCPSIPTPTPVNTLETMRSIKELLDVREGLTGDPLDQVVTYREMYQLGMFATSFLNGKSVIRLPGLDKITYLDVPKGTDAPEFNPPPAATGLSVSGALANFIISWNTAQYHQHAYTEVWRSGTDNIGTAVRVGTTPASLYADNLGTTATTRYYWIRHVSRAGVAGPFNATAGTSDTTDTVGTIDITAGAITTTLLADGSVVTVKLGDAAVTTTKTADSAITEAKIGAAAVTTSKIGDSAVTTIKVGDLQISSTKLADGAVITDKLGAAAVTTTKLANLAVTTAILDASAVTETKIASDAVTTPKILAGAITTAKIAAGAVTANEIAANTITAGQIAAGTITATEIAANAIVAAKIAAGAVVAGKLAADAIVAGDGVIANLAIGTAQIQDAAIVNAKIGNLAVDAAKIANATIVTAKIADAQITNALIVDATIQGGKIAASTITADKMSVTTLSAISADLGEVTAGSIRAVNVNASSHTTKGSYITSATVGGDATVNVQNTSDFPAAGSGWIVDSTNDRDAISWTGKTATTLTGCTGVLAHNSGATIIPQVKNIFFDANTNEMRFFGDRGDGTVEELASIGIKASGADSHVGVFGSINSPRFGVVGSSSTGIGVQGATSQGYGVYGIASGALGTGIGVGGFHTVSGGTAVYGEDIGGLGQGVRGVSTTGYGVYGFASSSGGGIYGQSTSGNALVLSANATKGHAFLNPLAARPSSATAGQIAMLYTTGGGVGTRNGTPRLCFTDDGVNWRFVHDNTVFAG
jgi:hypothetical protein